LLKNTCTIPVPAYTGILTEEPAKKIIIKTVIPLTYAGY
jgi:hypothetical protein